MPRVAGATAATAAAAAEAAAPPTSAHKRQYVDEADGVPAPVADDAAPRRRKKQQRARGQAAAAAGAAEAGAERVQPPAMSARAGGGVPHAFEISDTRRVSVRSFKGRLLVDIREYYADKDSGEMKPGKKGIALTEDQWLALLEAAEAIDEAITEVNQEIAEEKSGA